MSQAGIINVKGSGTGPVETLTGNSGGAVPPTGGNINVLAVNTNTVVGNPGTSTLTITPTSAGYPITPYVVGPLNQAGYQTIQSALNAANAASGGMVFIQFGTYTENLTLYNNVQIFGDSESGTTIIGTHTPPTSGIVNINRVTFESATNIFSSSAAGTAQLLIEDTTFNVTDGYTFNLPNWTGQIQCFNIGNFGTNDGGINNTGGATVFLFNAGLGNGTSHAMTLSGVTVMQGATIDAPVDFVTGSNFSIDNTVFGASLTFSNNSAGYVQGSDIISGSGAAITMSSSGAVGLFSNTINSSNNPAIAGSGAGTLTVGNLTFISNKAFANTLTLSGVAGYLPGAFGTTGQVLTSNGNGSVPTFQAASASGAITTITGNSGGAESPSSGNFNIVGTGSITVAGSANTETVQLTGLTNHALQIGAGTATLTQLAAGTTGQILQTNTSADPTWSTATYPSTTTVNQLLYSSSANTVGGLATANQGVLTTGTGGIPVITSIAGNGQLIIGSTAGAPAAATLSAGTGISITNGSNSITIAATGSEMTWTDEATNFNAAAGNGYFVTGVATATLPASPSQGNIISFVVDTTSTLTVTANTGQTIRIGSALSASAGTAANNARGDSVTFVYRSSDTEWIATSVVGTWTVT